MPFTALNHGANMFRRGAAASAQNSRAQDDGFARKQIEIFRRGFRIDHAIAGALRKSHVGHGAHRKRAGHRGEFLQNAQMVLRAHGAVRADHLHAALVQNRPGIFRPRAAEGAALFGVGHLGDDGQLRKRTNRIDRRHKFVGIAESFQDKKIHAAFFERLGLLAKNFLEMFRAWPRAHRRKMPSGPIDPAIRTSCRAASRASRAIFTPR